MKAYDSQQEHDDENKWSRLLQEDKGAATWAGIGAPQKKSRSREKRGALSRNCAQTARRRGNGFLCREGAELAFLFLPTCPPEILSAAASAPGALTDSETKTPQPRCSARPRPLLLKGQQPGWRRRRGRRWRKEEAVVGVPIVSLEGLYQSCEEHSVAFEDPIGRISKLVQNISF